MSVIVQRMLPNLHTAEALFKAEGCDVIGDIHLFGREEDRDVNLQLWHALKLAVEDLLESGPTDPDLVEIYGDNVPEWVHESLKALHDEMMTIPPGMTQPPHG